MKRKSNLTLSFRAVVMLLVMLLATVAQTTRAENTMYVIAEEIGGTISIGQRDENNIPSSNFTAYNIRLTFYYGERPSGYTEGSTVWSQRTASIGGSCIFDVPTSADTPAWFVSISKKDAARRQEAVVEVLFDPSFAAAKPTSTAYWFQYMKNLRGLNLNDLDVSKLTNAKYMFHRCTNLKYIYCESNWDRSKLSTSSSMFGECTSLPGYNAHKVDKAKAKPQPDGYFTTIGLTYNTAGGYYEINDEQDLIDLGDFVGGCSANHCEGKTFKLTADLDFTNMPNRSVNGNSGNFHPIGLVEDASFNGCFSGHFDGQNHTIKGLSYTNKMTSGTNNNAPVGLFKKVYGSNAVVERVLLIDPQMSGRASGCGGIAGDIDNGATIRNCTVLGGSIVHVNGVSGGIVGAYSNNATTIEGCTVIGTSVQDGMIIGSARSQNTIKDCIYYAPDGKGICSNYYTDGGGNQRVYQLTLDDGITATDATYSNALLPGKAYYASGATVSLDADRPGYMFKAYESSEATITGNTFTMPANDVSVTATWYDLAHFGYNEDPLVDGSAEHPYVISTTDGWNQLCDALDDNTTWNHFTGKTVKLGADITVSRIAGSNSHDFSGTFDGAGHKLTVNLTGTGNYTAPFYYLKPQSDDESVTIRGLKVDGTINTASKYAGGLVGGCHGKVNIIDCVSDVTINSSVSGDGTHGGLVGRMASSGTLSFDGCAFTGKMLTTNGTANCGGFLGWTMGTVNINNCLYAPAVMEDGETEVESSDSKAFARLNNTAVMNINNSFYTRTLGTAQGIQARNTTTLPTNIGEAGEDYRFVKAYAKGLKCNDLYYMVPEALTLANASDNDVESISGYFADVTLADRSLTKDGTWNTLCLPFSLSAEQIAESPLAGATIKEMDSSTSLSNDGLLTLNFKNAQSIEAGKAYIVKWETKGENIANPVFSGVTISNAALAETESTDGKVKFVGQYSPFTIDNDNINEILFIGSGNKIGYSKNPRQLKSCRAHFWVQPNGFSAGARVINIDLGDGVTTSINLVETDDEDASANGIYSLDGRRVKGEPTQKGVYVVNGKKIVK